MSQFHILFHRSGRGKAQCPPDPAHPDGVNIDGSTPGKKSCLVELPYPAPECGQWLVRCGECGLTVMVTAAGRLDDPRTVKVSCKP